MKTIKVKNCYECPLHEFDDIYLENSCELIDGLLTNNTYDTYPENCPLKKEPVKIELKNE